MTASHNSNRKPRCCSQCYRFAAFRYCPHWAGHHSGITLGALGIPEVTGYTKIIGTPVITGLCRLFLPVLMCVLFGSSRHLVVAADSATAGHSSTIPPLAQPADTRDRRVRIRRALGDGQYPVDVIEMSRALRRNEEHYRRNRLPGA